MGIHVPLPGSQRELLPNSRGAGPVDSKEIARLTIRVRSGGNLRDLEQRVQDMATQSLAERNYLTHDELEAKYGAAKDDLDRVEHYAQSHDLTVVHRSAAERSVVVEGTLGALLSAFPADVRMYHHASGTYRGRRGPISIPEELNGIVTGVFGFDTRRKHRAPHRHKALATASGPGGQNGVAATEFARRYNFPTTFGGVELDGSGQTIAIVELGGGFRASDLKLFFQEIQVDLPRVSAVSVDHAGNRPSTAESDDGEVMLDIEVAGAVAPKANYAVYFAPNNGDKGFLDAISAAVHDKERKPCVISISWGGPEAATDQQGINAFHELFVSAAALGITICVAAGDHGTADLDADHWDGQIHVDHPSCDDLVLSCGGTQIDSSGNDVVWNDNTPFDVHVPGGGGWATGGGISQTFKVPPYQQGVMKDVQLVTKLPGRGVPDIAMSATNYFTRTDRMEGASGGTSAVAPLMAALVARLSQAKKKNVGFLNTFLYANVAKGVVKDVTDGTNAIRKTVQGYVAGPGWDACSGLGTPDGAAILAHL